MKELHTSYQYLILLGLFETADIIFEKEDMSRIYARACDKEELRKFLYEVSPGSLIQ